MSIQWQRLIHVLDEINMNAGLSSELAGRLGVDNEIVREFCAGQVAALRKAMPECRPCHPGNLQHDHRLPHTCCPHQTHENGHCNHEHWWEDYDASSARLMAETKRLTADDPYREVPGPKLTDDEST